MRNILLICLLMVSAVLGRNSANYTGYGDTTSILDFDNDSLKYGTAGYLSATENMRVSILINDSNETGFADDSVFAVWGVQTGREIRNASGEVDTAWNPQMLIADTFDIAIAPTWGPQYILIDSTGRYTDIQSIIDTVSVSGFAVQSRTIAPAWDVIYRPWIRGITGNNVGAPLVVQFSVTHRTYQSSR